jgi:carboxyl-terminal processing protease
MRTRTLHFLLVIVISALIGYYFGVTKVNLDWKNYKPHLEVVNKQPPPSVQTADFSLFWTVLAKVQSNYYDKKAIDPQKLVYGAITGMVQSIGDPYTMFLPPTQNTNFKEGLAGQFTGIGAELGLKDKQIIVVSPLDGSPALKAGIKAGDTIVKVNNEFVDGWTLAQTVEKIRGPKGTDVALTVLHKSAEKVSEVKITRDVITVKSTSGWIKKIKDIDNVTLKDHEDEEIAYIRLSQFGDNTNKDWSALVDQLSFKLTNDKNVKGMVFDLRNNPGGYLTDATFIASEFIKEGIVVIEDKGNNDRIIFNVERRGVLTEVPLVVLINKGSASAAEIVSGAIRDHGRAKLVGETSFGKGTVQEAEDLGNGAGIHVTIARWLTPNETWVGNGKDGAGLVPDVPVAADEKNPSHDVQLEKAIEQLLQ